MVWTLFFENVRQGPVSPPVPLYGDNSACNQSNEIASKIYCMSFGMFVSQFLMEKQVNCIVILLYFPLS